MATDQTQTPTPTPSMSSGVLSGLGTRNAGVNPNDVQKQLNQNQKIAEILSGIENRLANITNIKSNVQSAVFDAFGNNFVSRSITQATDAAFSGIESLLKGTSKEETPDDKIISELKKHTEVMVNMSKKNDELIDLGKKSVQYHQEVITHTLDADRISKQNHQIDQISNDRQFDILLEIKNSLTDLNQSFHPEGRSSQGNEPPRKVPDDNIIPMLGDDSIIRSVPKQEADIDSSPETDKSPIDVEASVKTTNTLLGKILDVLMGASRKLDKLVEIQPISSQEYDLESKKSSGPALIKDDVMDVEEGKKNNKFDWTRIFKGMLDFDANMRGITNILGKLAPIATTLMGTMSSLGTGIMGFVKMIPGIVSNIGSVLGTVLKLAGRALPFAAGAAVMGGVGYAVDAAAGALGVGGNEIDEKQDDANWEKMSFTEKLQSGAARGIEKAGSFVFLDNIANEAKAERIKKETAYLNKSVDGKASAIEQSQKEVELFKKEISGKGSDKPVVVNNSSVTNNQTIMGSRPVVKNNEGSFNRYLDSSFYYAPSR